ncbi:MAG TPA: sugar phosphate isomerase/epimerase [Thermomicrobiales bacterium]|nr:sugar phosphate isomerase/epimerase [Thermomicrobiales bacterium]
MVDPSTSDGMAALSEIEGSHDGDIGINASDADAGTNQALEAADQMALVDHPAVGIALDPSHATYAGEDVAQIARTLGDLVKHVHLRDAIGQDILVVPGDGTVDFTALASALGEIGYGRAAIIELEYEDATAAEVRPDLARAKELLAKDFAVA